MGVLAVADGYNKGMNAERFRTNVFVAVLLIALGLCLLLFRPFVPALAWAFVLAILIYPTHRRIRGRIRNTTVSAGLSTLLTIALIVIPLLLMLLAITAEGVVMVKQARALIENGAWEKWAPKTEAGVLGDVKRWVGRYVDLQHIDAEAVAKQGLSRVGTFLAGNAAGFFQRLGQSFVQVGLALVTLFFILKDGSRVLPAVKAFIPLDDEQTDTVLSRAVETMYATFYGVVLVAMLQGTLGGIAFWILGLPSPLLWGAVMTGLCIIPLAGAPIVWVPAAVLLALQGEYVRAIILALIGWLVVGTVDNITRPFIIGGRTSLHPLAVFFSILGGLLAMGGVGVFLGPVLLSVTLALLEILRLKLGVSPPGPPETAAGTGSSPEPAKTAAAKSVTAPVKPRAIS